MTSITFLNLQMVKYLLFWCKIGKLYPHIPAPPPPPTAPPPTPRNDHPFLPLKRKIFFSNSCLSVVLSVYLDLWSMCNSTTTKRTLWTWYRYLNVYGSLGMKFYKMSWVTWPKWPPQLYMVKILKNLLLQHRLNDGLSTGTRVLPRLFKWWPWVDLTLFYSKFNDRKCWFIRFYTKF